MHHFRRQADPRAGGRGPRPEERRRVGERRVRHRRGDGRCRRHPRCGRRKVRTGRSCEHLRRVERAQRTRERGPTRAPSADPGSGRPRNLRRFAAAAISTRFRPACEARGTDAARADREIRKQRSRPRQRRKQAQRWEQEEERRRTRRRRRQRKRRSRCRWAWRRRLCTRRWSDSKKIERWRCFGPVRRGVLRTAEACDGKRTWSSDSRRRRRCCSRTRRGTKKPGSRCDGRKGSVGRERGRAQVGEGEGGLFVSVVRRVWCLEGTSLECHSASERDTAHSVVCECLEGS